MLSPAEGDSHGGDAPSPAGDASHGGDAAGDDSHGGDAPPSPAGDDSHGPAEGDLPPKSPQEPKKKRVFLKDMTPNSKEVELERRKQAKRDNSNKWHSKWASKGVRKNVDECGGEEPSSSAAPAAAADPAEPEDDVFRPDAELLLDAVSGDMRKVRANFMKKWSEWKGGTNPEIDPETLRTMSGKAWMESELWAEIMATRKHQQY